MVVECSTAPAVGSEPALSSMERPAQGERKRACPFADRGDGNNSEGDDGVVSAEREAATRVRVVEAVGCDGRVNEVFLTVASTAEAAANVVFFPGDAQDSSEKMMEGPCQGYSAYAYENVLELLRDKFGSACSVWIVRPSEFAHGVFSCFRHFVRANDYGAATEYEANGSATAHLIALMRNVRDQLFDEGVTISLDVPVHLVGFSKGGCVLNQLVTELAGSAAPGNGPHSNNDAEGDLSSDLFAKVTSVHWLDSGNGSREGALPTNHDALAELARLDDLQVFVHVTPYQYESKDRPWIKTEVKEFLNHMSFLGGDVQLMMYDDGEPSSVETHFEILRDFETHCAYRRKAGAAYSPEHAVRPIRIETCK